MKNISDLKTGENGIIQKVECSGEIKKRLIDMGITRGTKIKVIKIAPLGDPIEVEVKNYKLSLRKSEAKEILLMEE